MNCPACVEELRWSGGPVVWWSGGPVVRVRRRSLDCETHDEAVRFCAQDDNFVGFCPLRQAQGDDFVWVGRSPGSGDNVQLVDGKNG
jgi:hypothetical protein